MIVTIIPVIFHQTSDFNGMKHVAIYSYASIVIQKQKITKKLKLTF